MWITQQRLHGTITLDVVHELFHTLSQLCRGNL